MVSPKTNLVKGVSLFVLTFFLADFAVAQCNPPDQTPTTFCEDAPLVCLNNACYETLNEFYTCCDGFCGGGTQIHNPQFFQFIPTSPDVEIHIHVDNCDSGNSLQSAIVGACPWDNSDIIVCDPGTPVGGTMILIANGLMVGQVYWLLIDGSSGATCNYTIEYVSGIYQPGLLDEVTEAEAIPESACQGYLDLQFVANPPVGNAHGYYWVLGWNNDTITSTLPETTIDIPTDMDPGIYEVCVRAFSGCDTMDNEVCFEFEVYEIPPEEKEPATFCPEEFPFSWGSVNISGPGDYDQTFNTPEGCVFDSTWTVEEYPEVPIGEVDTLHCEEYLIYEGEEIDEAGTYEFFYDGAGLNGCDSTAEITVTLAAINAFIELTCDNGEFVLTPHIQDIIPFNADIEWEWYESGTLIFDNIPLLTLEGGCYDLFATVITNAGECTFFIEQFCFTEDQYQPELPDLGFTDTLVCAQSGVFFEVIEDPFGDPLTYTWSVSPPTVPFYQDGSNIAEFDFANAGPSEVCVYATNECGDGPETCIDVDIKPTPIADFSYDLDLCADSTTIVTFTGSASPQAEIQWDFSNPTTITGSGIGPYEVSWAVPGDKVITLTVAEPGCDTSYNSGIVSVTNLIAPVVNCISTLTSVFFDWDDVAGVSGYTVSINNGPAVPTATSEWMVSGLTPGTVINMTMVSISAGACEDIIITTSCTAEDCPPPAISIVGQDSACLNSPAVIDLDALVNGNPEPGVWAGNGIIDAAQGLFDPKVAAAGQHQVTFTVNLGGCDFTEPYLITVFDSITADFTIDPRICITDNATLVFTGSAQQTANFDFSFGSASVVSGSGSGPYILNWSSPGTQTVRLQINENGCYSETISQNTDVVAELNPALINCSPNTSGIIFTWTVDGSAIDTIVNTLTSHTGTQSGNTLEFTGLTPGDIVEIEVITVSAGPCPSRRDTLSCEARACPMPVIALTPVNKICLYPGTGTVDLEVSVTGGTGTGSGDWSGPGVTDLVNGVFDPVIAGQGSHSIIYHYNDDGCDFFENLTIDVYDPPGAFISTTDLMITCTAGSIFLDGSSSSGGALDFNWSTSNGVILSGDTTAVAEAGAAGVYQLLVSGATSGCKDSTTVVVTEDDAIPDADAGPDKTMTCDSTQFTLGGNSSQGPNIVYDWSTTNGNIVATNGRFITVNRTGQYDLVVRDTLTGCDANDRADVFIDTAVATIQLVAGDTIDCNTPISTVTSTLSEPANDYNLSWSTPDGTIEGNSTGTSIEVSQGGTYTLTIEDKTSGCISSESEIVPESDEIIDGVEVTIQNVVCNGQNNGVLVVENVDGGIPPYTYQWSSNQNGEIISPLPPGQYSLTVSDQNGCSYTESYTITEPPAVTLDVGPHMTVSEGDSVTLGIETNLTPPAIDLIQWGGDDAIDCPDCPVIHFIASSSTTITAIIADMAGCSASDSMRLTVIVPRIIFIPNVFSPNGDGQNDYFTISGRHNLVNIGYMKIFDRWGNQVFEAVDLTPGVQEEGWDGKYRGELMQPGVYAFVARLDYEDISQTVTGDITILR